VLEASFLLVGNLKGEKKEEMQVGMPNAKAEA